MKKKVLTAIILIASIVPIWLGGIWWDKPVQKPIRGGVDWSRWN